MAFSAAGTRPITLTGQCDVAQRGHGGEHRGAAGHVALHRQHALGRLDVEAAGVEGDALADQHHGRRLRGRAARGVVETDQAGRRRRGGADGEHAAEALLGEPLPRPRSSTSRPAARGDLLGLVGQPGRGLEVGGHRGEHPRTPAGAADGQGLGQLVVGDLGARCRPRTMRATGRSSGPVERQWKPNEPSIAPTTKAPRPSSGAIAVIEVATLARSLVARARVAPARRKSVTDCSPTPTSSSRLHVVVRRRGR